jgi:hypothetical protein
MKAGWSYRLVTEAHTDVDAWLSNARKLLRRGRIRAPDPWAISIYDRVRKAGALPLAEFAWDQSRVVEGAWVASELIRGRLRVDLKQPLTRDSLVYVPTEAAWETLPW